MKPYPFSFENHLTVPSANALLPYRLDDSPPTDGAPKNLPPTSTAQRGRVRAQRTAFSSRHAIVIGPTPPGTGVIAEATSTAPGSTSPTRPASVRLMPTSTTTAPI